MIGGRIIPEGQHRYNPPAPVGNVPDCSCIYCACTVCNWPKSHPIHNAPVGKIGALAIGQGWQAQMDALDAYHYIKGWHTQINAYPQAVSFDRGTQMSPYYRGVFMDEILVDSEPTPPYLTVMAGSGCFLVALMEANRKGEYRIAKQSPSLTQKRDAENWALAWSEREGIEIR